MVKRIAIGTVLVLATVYVCDYVSVRFQIPPSHQAYGTVVVKRYYAVPLKDKKTEYMSLEPETETCVNSLFPHMGNPPCWYLTKHNRKQINM